MNCKFRFKLNFYLVQFCYTFQRMIDAIRNFYFCESPHKNGILWSLYDTEGGLEINVRPQTGC